MEVGTIGLDLAKNVFQVHSINSAGEVVVRKTLRRAQMRRLFEQLELCLVGIEACGTSHYWAREIGRLGRQVRLMPPAYVKPYVKRGKSNTSDAEAICETVTRPTMRFVAIKSAEQRAVLALHRTEPSTQDVLERVPTVRFFSQGIAYVATCGEVGTCCLISSANSFFNHGNAFLSL